MIALVFAAALLASPARAASTDTVDTEQLQQDADLLATMTDTEYVTNAGRSRVSDMPTGGQSTGQAAGDDTPDSRLSRPRTLSMVYDTLAAYEYNQAADSGLLPQPELIETGARLKAYRSRKAGLFADPATRKPSSSYARVSRRLAARRAAVQTTGRSTGARNKKLAALGAQLSSVRKELADPRTPAARKAALHAKAGKIYEDMSAAARYQASVAVVTASVLDDDGNALTANESTDHPNAAKPARKAGRVAAKPKAKRVADDAAAQPAAPAPSEEDEVRQGEADMNQMEQDMHQQVLQRAKDQ